MERSPAPRGSAALLAAALLVVALAVLVAPVGAAGPVDRLPDLVADPPTNTALDYHTFASDNSQELLLRFDGYIHNAGAGALEIGATRADGTSPLQPLQRVYRSDASFHDDAMPAGTELFYSNADGHHHWHLQRIARYSLWNSARTAEVAPALKVGFCLGDIQHSDSFGPSARVYGAAGTDSFCRQNQPNTTSLLEGVSSGWRDVYDRSLALQWVVVSDVLPGSYYLREDVDPDQLVHENDEANAPAWTTSTVTIPGYLAKPLAPAAGAYGSAQHVTLAATTFGSPGTVRFRVLTAPAHGTLDVRSGDDLTDPDVTYTPAPGYSGADSFTYEALDSTSRYPLHPQVATVALSVGAPASPSVVIDTGPSSVQLGNGAQFHASVSNDLGGVTWSVDGVDGGGAGAGTITPSGFYTAPPRLPASGHVTIGARSASGAHDARVVAITLPPAPPPAPWANDPGPPRGALLSRIGAVLSGRVLAAGVTPARAGIVSIRARIGKTHKLGSCQAQTPKGRRFTCSINVAPGMSLAKLHLAARLERHGKFVATVYRDGPPRARR